MSYVPITYSLLKEKKACYHELQKFVEVVGLNKPMTLTKEFVNKFYYDFTVEWSAENLLTQKDYKEYKKVKKLAFADFHKIKNVAWSRYQKEMEPVLTQYRISKNLAKTKIQHHCIFNVYKEALDVSWASYVKVVDAAHRKCCKIAAQEFVNIYKKGMK